jgi:hypothetical protein
MRQITVLVDDRPGVLADISSALADRGINIDTLVCDAAEEHGVVSLSVDRYDESLIALRDAGFQAISEDALVLRLPDEPGALAKAAVRFKDAGINIRSLRILRREGGVTLVSLVSEDNERAKPLVDDFLVSA